MLTTTDSPLAHPTKDNMDVPNEPAIALQRLAESSVAELRFLRVDECDQKIRLTGSVRSFYHKQLAQETVRRVAAGRQVINEVIVA